MKMKYGMLYLHNKEKHKIMIPHKTILFDKSVVVGLSYKNFKNLSYHLSPFIIPPLITELIEELGKSGDINNLRDKLKVLASKCIAFRTQTINTYNHFLLSDLMGDSIPLDGRIPVNRGVMVRHKDGTTTYIMEESEEIKTLRRWSQGQFLDSDIKEGQKVKELKNLIKEMPKALKEVYRDLDKHLPEISNLIELRKFVDKNLETYEKDRTENLIKGLHNRYFYDPKSNLLLEEMLEKWKKKGSLPLSQYAKYAFYCLKLNNIYHIGIKCNLIETSKKQNTYFDLQYIYYLPFCQFFSSNDNFHKKLSSIFLREDQKFIKIEDLKKDSTFIKSQKQKDKCTLRSFYKKKLNQYTKNKSKTEKLERNSNLLKNLNFRFNEGIRVDNGKSLERGNLTKKYDRLTLKEKSLELIFKIQAMFDPKKHDWRYVKKNLNLGHVKEFYEFYGDIWRPDSDIFRYYETRKYSSFVLLHLSGSHRIKLNFIFSLSIYFDGFYIFDFFKNPWVHKKDYNPISSPGQYVVDSLKDFFTILNLQSFIATEHVKILPLPSEFIADLQKDIFSYGNKIRNDLKIEPEDEKIIKEDSLEMLLSLASRTNDPKKYLENELKSKVDQNMIDNCKLLRKNSPFVLDQEISGPEMNVRKVGTPESAYIISRLKGLPIITNSKTTKNAIIKNNFIEDNIWTDFMNKINDYDFKIIPEYSLFYNNGFFRDDPLFDLQIKKKFFNEFHLFLRDVFYYAIYFGKNKKNVDRLTKDLIEQLKKLDEQWKKFEEVLTKENIDPKKYIQSAKLTFIICPEGFKMPEADKWIEKYMKHMSIQKSAVLIYGSF